MKDTTVRIRYTKANLPVFAEYVGQVATVTLLPGGTLVAKFDDGRELCVDSDQYVFVDGDAGDLKNQKRSHAPRSGSGTQDRRINRASKSVFRHFLRGTGPRY